MVVASNSTSMISGDVNFYDVDMFSNPFQVVRDVDPDQNSSSTTNITAVGDTGCP